MKRILLLLSLFSPLALAAQIVFAPISVDSFAKDATELVREKQISMEITSPEEGVYRFRAVVTILSKNSKANVLRVSYDPQTPITKLSAATYDALGMVKTKYKKDDFSDYAAVDGFSVYQDSRIKVLVLEPASYPATLEWEYEQKIKGAEMAILPDWSIQGFGTAVKKASFEVKVANGINLLHRSKNIQLEPKITDDGKSKTYRWEVSNLSPIIWEPNAPEPGNILPEVQVALDKFRIDNYMGSMQSWKEYGTFLYNLAQGSEALPEELIAEIKPLLANAKTNREKIEVLYRFMQDRTRYVSVQLGIGGWRPFPASYVYKNKYGDCKALSNFMRSMLQYAGIKAYNVVIENHEMPTKLDEGFPADPPFNHMVLYVPDEKIWLECTSNTFPINYLGAENSNRQVLLVTEQGGQIIKTPVYPTLENTERWNSNIKVNTDGLGQLNTTNEYRGERHEMYRSMQHQLSAPEQRKYFLEESSLAMSHLDTLQFDASRHEPMTKLKLKGQMGKLGSRAGKRLFIPLNPLNPVTKAPAKDDKRKQAVVVQMGYVQENQLLIQLPEGFKVETMPQGEKNLNSVFGAYNLKVKDLGNGQIQVQRRLEVNATEQPASTYADLCNFYREVAKLDGSKLVLVAQ
jgi:Domain of Unknown Function with PDB structure (DUF3857)